MISMSLLVDNYDAPPFAPELFFKFRINLLSDFFIARAISPYHKDAFLSKDLNYLV